MIRQMLKRFPRRSMLAIVALSLLVTTAGTAMGAQEAPLVELEPTFSTAAAFDVSPAARDLAQPVTLQRAPFGPSQDLREIRPDRGPNVPDQGFSGDGALQGSSALEATTATAAATIPSPLLTFEGLSNEDNRTAFGFRVAPPDPIGDVGPNHYVEMVNLVFAVYDKQGNLLLGPVPLGALWESFEVEDCTDPSGDPIVLYDQLEDRWILSQFTTRGFDDPTLPFYDCVAISQTGDPTGAYYRYAFITQPDTVDGGYFFPDYPKYGVWTDSYILTTRDFGLVSGYGISVYALEKNKMLEGNPDARAVQFFLDSAEVPLSLIGDGLLPADIDGHRRPRNRAPAPIVGTMDDDGYYGATFDGLNIFELSVQWRARPAASLELAAQLPVAGFDSIFPCAPTVRDCIPQPGVTNTQYLDVLSYRQRPMWRLAYRNFGQYEAMVTNQAVEARPGMAGVRWYEIQRANNGDYSVNQQGTYAPDDGVHRWMGSIAMDWQGNMALGYSVSNATDVYPGIRYTGRLSGDPLGEMSLGEATVIDGTGSQLTTNSRWGDYTSMNVDPADDCTFWYVNQYYAITELAAWQTRIASFILPGCTPQIE
jgi:hypothetical protein